MSGFFKKLFNRITGKGAAETPAPVEAKAPEVEALPAPAPAPEPEPEGAVIPEPVVEPVPPPVEVKKPLPEKIQKAEPPKPPAKKVEAKPVEAKKPEPKKPEPKKPEPKKPEAKKPELKKAEPKKPEPKKVETKRPEPKKAELKTEPPKPTAKPKAAAPQPVKKAEPEPAKKTAPKALRNAEDEPKPAPRPQEVPPEPKPEPSPPPPPEIPPPPAPVPEPAPPPELPPDPVPPAAPQPTAAPRPAFKPAPVVPQPQPEPVQEKKGWLARLTSGLSKSSKSITTSITSIFTKRKLDASTLEELEDVLIQADLGITVSERIIKAVSTGRYDKEIEPDEVKRILAEEVTKVLKPVEVPFNFGTEKPFVILVVGVNGAGKTTTIGKLGAIASGEGFKVMFAACDTFRAAAIEQLTVWGQRIGAKTISRPTGADSSGLAYDALQEAKKDGTDILFIDTAGRLQNKAYLMDELDKIVRVIKKQDETAPHAVLLILDATTGQNAISQADIFTKVAGVTGLIMTKLDGTARGGILVAIAEKFKLPIHAIGVGESIEDLQPFDAAAFSRAIAGMEQSA